MHLVDERRRNVGLAPADLGLDRIGGPVTTRRTAVSSSRYSRRPDLIERGDKLIDFVRPEQTVWTMWCDICKQGSI